MELGLPPSEYWVQTPRRLEIIISAQVKARERSGQERAWLVWHTAVLSRIPKLPDFDEFVMGKAAEPPREKTTDELRAALIAWLGPPPSTMEH